MNDDTHTANSSHAAPVPHAFLNEIKAPSLKNRDLFIEQLTCQKLEAALNTLENIHGVTGKLRFKLSASEEGYQAYVVNEGQIIIPPEGLVS